VSAAWEIQILNMNAVSLPGVVMVSNRVWRL
jgi:hypothetical protein